MKKKSKVQSQHHLLHKIWLIMRLSVLICLMAALQISANTHSQTKRISLNVNNIDIREAFREIERSSGLSFLYFDEAIQVKKNITLITNNRPIGEVLEELLKDTKLTYKLMDNKFIVISPINIIQQQKITGIITDATTNEPIIGANVIIEGTTIGVVTDVAGKFSLDIIKPDAVLVVSYLGYNSERVSLNGQLSLIIKLIPDITKLEEVVVVGYGTQKKVNLTGAISNVSSDVLKDRPLTSLGQGLQGAIANLNIAPIDGQPGRAASFNIRGYTGIGTSEAPLILVDGVIMDANLINPSDVASVTVLKDAASSAIYGARAAYGVILITTKIGKKNQPFKVNFTSNFSFGQPTRFPKVANSWETLLYEQSAFGVAQVSQDYKDKLYAHFTDPSQPFAYVQGNSWKYFANTDWYNEAMLNRASSNKQDINFTGGTDKITYFVSGGLQDQGGLFKYGNDGYKKYNFRSDIKIDLKSWISFNFKSIYTNTDYNAPSDSYGIGSYWHGIVKMPSSYPVKNPDGEWDTDLTNPIQFLSDGGRYIKQSSDSWVVFGTEIRPFAGFKIKGDFSVNYNAENARDHKKDLYTKLPTGIIMPTVYTTSPFAFQQNSTGKYNALNIWSEYETTLAEKHYLKFLVGFNQEHNSSRWFNAKRYDPVNSNIGEINLASGLMEANSGSGDWSVRGAFVRLNYIFNDKYLLEINSRYDGSSKFPKNDRFGIFPSLSLGWRISKESFMQWMQPMVNELKLRASYGSLGNQNVSGNYPYIANMHFTENDPGNHNFRLSHFLDGTRPMGVDPSGLVSPSLTWVKINALNFGLDFSMFKNRLSLAFDIYNRESNGILGTMAAPAILGTDPPLQNLYNMETRGWEITFAWRDQITKNLTYNVGLNLSDYVGKITKYDSNPTNYIFDYYKGGKIGEIWGWQSDNLFQTNDEAIAWENQYKQSLIFGTPPGGYMAGDMKFEDINNNGAIEKGTETLDNPGDRKIIGNNTPRYSFGITTGLQWKGFDLSAFFQGVGKRDWQMGSGSNSSVFWGPEGRAFDYNLDYWSATNPSAYYPRVNGIKEAGTTRYIQNAAYIRLKSLIIGYTIPKTVYKRIGIDEFRIYCSGQNLWTYTKLIKGVDPEGIVDPQGWGDGEVYPIQKALSVGLNITF